MKQKKKKIENKLSTVEKRIAKRKYLTEDFKIKEFINVDY